MVWVGDGVLGAAAFLVTFTGVVWVIWAWLGVRLLMSARARTKLVISNNRINNVAPNLLM